MSDTPRTDAFLATAGADQCVYLAQALERELAESRAYAEEMRAALEVAVSLVHIPDHAWDTDDDARLAKCVAALANHQPKEK